MAIDPYSLSGKEERLYRRENPYSDYSKQKEMRFLNDIDKMKQGNQGVSDAQVTNYDRLKNKWNYKSPWEQTREKVLQNPINPDKYKTELASVEDISKKYGFDFSRDYAKKQSEMIAQQKRDAGKEGLKRVDNAVMGASEALDRDYFQQFANQAQGQTNSGLNAGIAADQNLRLAMSRQAEMGDVYRDANAQKFQLNNDLARVDQEQIAMEDQMYNERLQQAFQNILAEGQFNQTDNIAALDAALKQYDQFLDIEQLNQNWSMHKDNRKLDWAKFNEQARQFDNLSAYEDAKLGQDWSMHKDNRKLNWAQFNEGAKQFDENLAQRQKEFLTEFNNLSAYQQEQVSLEQARNQLARDQFNKEYSDLTAYQKAQINQQKDELAQRAFEFMGEMELARGYQGENTGDDAYYNLDKSDFTQGAGSKNGSLGSLSSKYESSGNPGTIGRNAGDWGGASYGTYQIATNTGTMNSFLSYVNKNHKGYAFNLNQAKPGTAQFDKIWKNLAAKDPKGFQAVQHGFIKSSHYDPAASRIKSGLNLDMSKQHPAVQDVLWSTAVQHGASGAYNVWKNAGVKPGMSAQEIINRVYNERSKVNQYFSKSSSSIKQSVYNRFQEEREDALAMI